MQSPRCMAEIIIEKQDLLEMMLKAFHSANEGEDVPFEDYQRRNHLFVGGEDEVRKAYALGIEMLESITNEPVISYELPTDNEEAERIVGKVLGSENPCVIKIWRPQENIDIVNLWRLFSSHKEHYVLFMGMTEEEYLGSWQSRDWQLVRDRAWSYKVRTPE